METETKNFRERTKSLESSIRQQENIRIILLSLLGIAVLVSALIIYRKQYELRRQRRESEITLAELEHFKNSLVEKSRQIEDLENSHEKKATLEALRANTILTEAEWDHFKTLFEKAHQGFFNRLKKQFPELTPGEIRLISLTKLNLTNKEMAATLGVGAGAIRTMKSRLMKKLNLPENETLEKIIDEL